MIGRLEPSRILFANARAEETFGLRAGLEGDAVRTIYVRPEERAGLVERLRQEGRVDNLEIELRRADGRTMWALMSARTVAFGGQPAMLIAVTDISERKRDRGGAPRERGAACGVHGERPGRRCTSRTSTAATCSPTRR